MKVLIFGIDGLGVNSLNYLGLRRLKERLEKGVLSRPVINNVISRGWPEIYTGCEAHETGGFYQIPYCNEKNKIIASQKTGLSRIKKFYDSDQLLWNKVNASGMSVGLFTVPTITKPEIVDGFCVAATGAGKFSAAGLKSDLHPEDLFDGISIDKLDLGIRMGYGGVIPKDLDGLEKYLNKHISDYFFVLKSVLEKKPVDVLFAVSRFITAMAFKFIGVFNKKSLSEYELALKSVVLSVCNNFDRELDQFISLYNPDHCFIVSDHGVSSYDYDLNLNEILVKAGLLKKKFHIKKALRPYVNSVRSYIYKKPYPCNVLPTYSFEDSEVFSIGYMNALYVNDSRFTGPEMTLEERSKKAKSFCDILNRFVKKRSWSDKLKFIVSDYDDVRSCNDVVNAPDIICKMENGINNSERQHHSLIKKEFYFEEMLSKGFYGEHSGCKTDDTITHYQGAVNSYKSKNLVDVYKLICEVVESYEKN